MLMCNQFSGFGGAADASDPYWAGVGLLLHMDDVAGTTTNFINNGSYTASSWVNDQTTKCATTAAIKHFDTNVLNVTGQTRCYADFNGVSIQGDYTAECWVYVTGFNNAGSLVNVCRTVDNVNITESLFSVETNATGSLVSITYAWLGGTRNTASITGVLNTWLHCAVSRNGDTFKCFFNGVEYDSYTHSHTPTEGTWRLKLGYWDGGGTSANGYVDDIRVTKGVGRYTTNFTPSGAPFFPPEWVSIVKSGFIYSKTDGTEKLYAWEYDTDAVRGPVNQDDFNRFYWTGKNGATKEFKFASVDDNTGDSVATAYKVGVIDNTGWDMTLATAGLSVGVVQVPPEDIPAESQISGVDTPADAAYSVSSKYAPPDTNPLLLVGAAYHLAYNNGSGAYSKTITQASPAVSGDLQTYPIYTGFWVGPTFYPFDTKAYGIFRPTGEKYLTRKTALKLTITVNSVAYPQSFDNLLLVTRQDGTFLAVTTTDSVRIPWSVALPNSTHTTYTNSTAVVKVEEYDSGVIDGGTLTVIIDNQDCVTRAANSLYPSRVHIPVPGAFLSSNPDTSDAAIKSEAGYVPPDTPRLAVVVRYLINGATRDVVVYADDPTSGDVPEGVGYRFSLTQDGTNKAKWVLALRTKAAAEAIVNPPAEEVRVYAITFVNEYGEESEPSLPYQVQLAPSAANTKFEFSQSTFDDLSPDPFLDRAALHGIRLYRSATGLNTSADYYYVGMWRLDGDLQADLAGENYLTKTTTTGDDWEWLDTVQASSLTSVLSTSDLIYDASELQGLQGLIAIHNGMLVAFKDNEAWVSEPYMPWAWKRNSIKTFPYKVISAQQHEQGFIVFTESFNYYVSGLLPEEMVANKIAGEYPLVGKRAHASVGGSTYYLSADGPVIIQGATANLDQSVINRESLKALVTRFSSTYSDILVGSIGHRLLIVFPNSVDPTAGGLMYDFDTQAWSFISDVTSYMMNAQANSLGEASSHLLMANGATWDGFALDTIHREWVWKSKDFVLPKAENFGCLQIHGTGIVTVKVYADAVLKHQANITLSEQGTITRLPSGFRASRWSIELSSPQTNGGALPSLTSVKRLVMASSMGELASA